MQVWPSFQLVLTDSASCSFHSEPVHPRYHHRWTTSNIWHCFADLKIIVSVKPDKPKCGLVLSLTLTVHTRLVVGWITVVFVCVCELTMEPVVSLVALWLTARQQWVRVHLFDFVTRSIITNFVVDTRRTYDHWPHIIRLTVILIKYNPDYLK